MRHPLSGDTRREPGQDPDDRPDRIVRYFAYGSNMLTARIRERVGAVHSVGRGLLRGWRLRYNKRGRDSSGKCNIQRAEGDSTAIQGVVFEIAPSSKARLDAAEGVGSGYDSERVEIERLGKCLHCHTYVAQASFVDESLRPFSWYRDLVVAGALEHGVDREYVEKYLRVEACSDPDDARELRNRQLLDGQIRS